MSDDADSNTESSTVRKRTQATKRDQDVFLSSRRPGENRDNSVMLLDERDAIVLLYQLADALDAADDLLPEWEVGVRESDDADDWDFYHPRAPDRRLAIEMALEEASEEFDDPVAYEATPFDSESDFEPWYTDDYDDFLAGKGVYVDG